MQKPDFSTFNSKLLKEEEISRALFQAYAAPSEDPHDDKVELSEQVEQQEKGQILYDFENKENQERESIDEAERMEEELLPALNQRVHEADEDDNDEEFFEM